MSVEEKFLKRRRSDSKRKEFSGISGPGSPCAGEFDQVSVGVTNIDRDQGTHCAGSLNGPQFGRDSEKSQVGKERVDREIDEEAEIGRTGSRVSGVRIDLLPQRMEIDFLASEGESPPSVPKCDRDHSQNTSVKRKGPLDIPYSQDEVVEPEDRIRRDHWRNPFFSNRG